MNNQQQIVREAAHAGGIHVSVEGVICSDASCLPRVLRVRYVVVWRLAPKLGIDAVGEATTPYYTTPPPQKRSKQIRNATAGEVTVALVQRGLRDDVPLRKSAQECNFIMSIEPADLCSIYS
ncbi:hypothetical protein Trydic_g23711 [Trypoxylus dichotomus]